MVAAPARAMASARGLDGTGVCCCLVGLGLGRGELDGRQEAEGVGVVFYSGRLLSLFFGVIADLTQQLVGKGTLPRLPLFQP